MKRTDEQEAVVSHVRRSSQNLVVEACAGSGKTSTLVEAINELPKTTRAICCAFNKRIATELESKMPSNADCRTMNSLGHRVWMSDCMQPVELETKKGWKAMDRLKIRNEQCPDLLRLVGLAKACGLVPSDASVEGIVPDRFDIWQDMIDSNTLDMGTLANPINAARDVLRLSIKDALNGIIDFDDQLYMPTVYQSTFPHPDVVMVDEAQDLSPIQHEMLHLMMKSAKLIAVGDRYQAIYAFRGAKSDSIPALEERWKCQTLPLSMSFRCPTAVVEEAQAVVPHIEPWSHALRGSVVEEGTPEPTLFREGGKLAVLCRNTKPLVSLCYELIGEGIPAQILGRDIATGLLALTKRWKRAKTWGELRERLNHFASDEGARLRAKRKETQAELLDEKVTCIGIIAGDISPHGNIDLVRSKIQSMFSDEKHMKRVTLSTIHKAKGLEWPDVYFLDRWLIPSRFAKTQEELQQERNLEYVAITRAQENLHYVTTER